MIRRIGVVMLVAVVLFGGALAVRAVVHRLTAKDTSSQQRIMRQRVDLIEADPFINALLAVPHSTQSVQESLQCHLPLPPRWNVRVALSGHLDLARLETVLGEPEAFGWVHAGPDVFARAIEPGFVAKLTAVVGADDLTVTTNLANEQACHF